MNTNRNFIGFELDPDYYNQATKRLEQHKSQIEFIYRFLEKRRIKWKTQKRELATGEIVCKLCGEIRYYRPGDMVYEQKLGKRTYKFCSYTCRAKFRKRQDDQKLLRMKAKVEEEKNQGIHVRPPYKNTKGAQEYGRCNPAIIPSKYRNRIG